MAVPHRPMGDSWETGTSPNRLEGLSTEPSDLVGYLFTQVTAAPKPPRHGRGHGVESRIAHPDLRPESTRIPAFVVSTPSFLAG